MPADDRKPWVLVVDDSRVVRRTIMKILGPEFNILEAVDGVAGWSVLRTNSRVEAVVTDIQMPEMDGYSLICKARAVEDPGLREIPFVVITSAEDDITRERAYACGANDFILKPFDANQLLGCVRSQLKDYQETTGELGDTPSSPAQKDAPVVVPNTNTGSVTEAVGHIDTGLNILRGLKTATIAPHALTLVFRLLPLLKYCNSRFHLDLDREIALVQQRIAAAKDKT